jgi:hypothetical protein
MGWRGSVKDGAILAQFKKLRHTRIQRLYSNIRSGAGNGYRGCQ